MRWAELLLDYVRKTLVDKYFLHLLELFKQSTLGGLEKSHKKDLVFFYNISVLLTLLTPILQNGQTHSNNSSAIRRRIV